MMPGRFIGVSEEPATFVFALSYIKKLILKLLSPVANEDFNSASSKMRADLRGSCYGLSALSSFASTISSTRILANGMKCVS
jgi:hypothetical protein